MKWLLFLNRYIRTLLLEGSPTNTIASNIQHNPIFIINIQYNPIFMGTAYNYGSFPLQTNKPKSQILYWQFTEVKKNNFLFYFMECVPLCLAPFSPPVIFPFLLSDSEGLTPKAKGLTLR